MSLPKWRLTQTGLIRLLFAIALVLASCYFARAQESSDAAQDDFTAAAQLSPTVEAALDAINRRDPQTPSELMDAVRILAGLDAADAARPFLQQVTDQELNDPALAQIHADLGTPALVRLANDKSLPEARELVHQIFAAARRIKRDPVQLQKAIAQLGSEDEAIRGEALVQLSQAGSHAVPAIIEALRTPPKGVTFDRMQAVLARVGDNGEDALIAALGSPDSFVQSIAAQALARVGSNRSAVHLIRPYFVGRDGAQQTASYALRELGAKYPSSVGESAAFLAKQATRHLEGAPPFAADFDGMLDMWTWSAEKKNVVPHRLTAREAAAISAARMARDAYELSPSTENTRLLLVSQLQADQLLNGLDELLPKGIGTAYDFGTTHGVASVCSALGYSLDKGYDPAAVGAAELVGDLCKGGVSAGNFWTPLTRALQSPNRRVRYAAARAIMNIDPRRAYTGASFMLEALVDMADASGVPGAIVATPRTETRGKVSGMLGSLGFSVHQANEGHPALLEALRISDYDLLVLSDAVSRPNVDETIQQLRKDHRTKLMPVILLASEFRAERTERLAELDSLTISMPEFANEAALSERLEEVEDLVSDFSVPPSRRLEQAKNALGWLAHLAQYSKTYPWYDLMRARDVAIQAAAQPELADAAVPLLGYLGDEESQGLLVNLASQESLSIEDRQRAANAFGEAVLRRGLMLRKASVYAQYDRYNASEAEEQPVQEVLGQILDIIETQTKPTSLQTP